MTIYINGSANDKNLDSEEGADDDDDLCVIYYSTSSWSQRWLLFVSFSVLLFFEVYRKYKIHKSGLHKLRDVLIS